MLVVLFFILLAGVFGYIHISSAGTPDFVYTVTGELASIFIKLMGSLTSLLINAFISLAQYNNFVNEDIVLTGFYIVRQLCMMFFVVILLVIAISTVLHIESYHWRRTLPKLMIMTVLIYFSLSITGFLIDLGQVVMLTFANAIRDVNGAGNFVNLFAIKEYASFSAATKKSDGAQWFNLVVASLFASFAMFLTMLVMAILVVVIVFRIVMLWIYAVLSPFAYLLQVFPGGQKYAAQWWSGFTQYVVSGPILVFFVWLALSTMQTTKTNLTDKINAVSGEGSSEVLCALDTAITCADNIVPYIMFLGFLIGAIAVTQQLGGAASKYAGAIYSSGMKPLRQASTRVQQFAGRHKGKVALTAAGAATGGVALAGVAAGAGILGGRKAAGWTKAGWKSGKGTFTRSGIGKGFGLNERHNREQQIDREAIAKTRKFIGNPKDKVKAFAEAARKKAELRRAEMFKEEGAPTRSEAMKYAESALGTYNKKPENKDRQVTVEELQAGSAEALSKGYKDSDFIDAMKYMRSSVGAGRGFSDTNKNTKKIEPQTEREKAEERWEKQFPNFPSEGAARMATPDEHDLPRGKGEISAGHGKGSTIAMDFDDEDFKDALQQANAPKDGSDYSRTKGVPISSDQFKGVAESLSKALKRKIDALGSGVGKQSRAQEQKLERIRRAKDRIDSITASGGQKMELVNSGAVGYDTRRGAGGKIENYGMRDVIKTLTHERAHGAGATDENNQAERIAHYINHEKLYSKTDEVTQAIVDKDDSGGHVTKMRAYEKAASDADAMVQQVEARQNTGDLSAEVNIENDIREVNEEQINAVMQGGEARGDTPSVPTSRVQMAGGQYFSVNQLYMLKKLLAPLSLAMGKLGKQNQSEGLRKLAGNMGNLRANLDAMGDDTLALQGYLESKGKDGDSDLNAVVEWMAGQNDKK